MIVLLGYMGSGKSSVSEYLKFKHGLKCCDLDKYIEEKEDKSIPEIFKKNGEIYFRKIENFYLKEILADKSIDLLSLGGGTPCYANNMELIKAQNTESIYLKVELNTLTERLFVNKESRPVIKGIENKIQLKDFLRKHLFEREYYYRQAKNILNVTDMGIENIGQKILEI